MRFNGKDKSSTIRSEEPESRQLGGNPSSSAVSFCKSPRENEITPAGTRNCGVGVMGETIPKTFSRISIHWDRWAC